MSKEIEVTCPNCNWEGKESELLTDYYEEFESSMPLACICPNCKNELD